MAKDEDEDIQFEVQRRESQDPKYIANMKTWSTKKEETIQKQNLV
jgi:hypothetical protein